MIDVQLSNDTRQEVVDYFATKVEKEKSEVICKNYEELVEDARNFLNSLIQIKISEKDILESLSEIDVERNNSDVNKIFQRAKKNIRNKIKTEKVLNAVLTFQNNINTFFQRDIILSVIMDNGNILFFDEEQEGKIFRKGTKNKGRLNLSFSLDENSVNFANPTGSLDEFIEEGFASEEQKDHIEKIRGLYNKSILRYDEIIAQNKNWKYIYWHLNGKRTFGYTNGKGAIGEGYVLALFEKKQNPLLQTAETTDDEPALECFYHNYIIAADNRAGAVAGDIADSILDKLQFAVKNGTIKNNTVTGFSSSSMGAFVDIARVILENKNLSKEEFAKALEEAEKSGKYRSLQNNPLIRNIEGKTLEEVTKFFNEKYLTK